MIRMQPVRGFREVQGFKNERCPTQAAYVVSETAVHVHNGPDRCPGPDRRPPQRLHRVSEMRNDACLVLYQRVKFMPPHRAMGADGREIVYLSSVCLPWSVKATRSCQRSGNSTRACESVSGYQSHFRRFVEFVLGQLQLWSTPASFRPR